MIGARVENDQLGPGHDDQYGWPADHGAAGQPGPLTPGDVTRLAAGELARGD